MGGASPTGHTTGQMSQRLAVASLTPVSSEGILAPYSHPILVYAGRSVLGRILAVAILFVRHLLQQYGHKFVTSIRRDASDCVHYIHEGVS